MEGNPDIKLELLPNEDIRWSAMVTLDESKSLNELDSLSNVFDTITGEYEDEDKKSPTYGEVIFAKYKYHQVEDFIEEEYKKSLDVNDFIRKVTNGMTNTTSVLSLEDQTKLWEWYNLRKKYDNQNESSK